MDPLMEDGDFLLKLVIFQPAILVYWRVPSLNLTASLPLKKKAFAPKRR